MKQEVKPWFFFKRKADNSEITLRLFMLPPAGGDVSTYLRWEEELPNEVELALVRLPGRGARIAEPAFDRAETLTEVLADEIAAYTDLPYVLFGHSMGGLLAYELVQKLHRRGVRLPETVIISSMKAPCYMDTFTESLTSDASDKLYLKSDDEFIDTIIGLGGIPDALIRNREFLQLILPTFRQDMKLCETYNPDEALAVPVSFEIYGGNRDSIATREELEGWRRFTGGNFALTLFQGGHFYFADHPQVVLFHLRNKLADICRTQLTGRTHS
ncbi:thioesterase II family protein [Paenibacillus tengchongensis]|uniref:thioesterase II family protein n=1 Tax=Paenibacillus tengchongensis TaxID=2608684 RepID=UPI001652A07F|nr:alpha/beta fold hydrolase [Paenibacillus tengchongensis]